jgi:hypothetical protein
MGAQHMERRYVLNLATLRELRLWYVANADLARLQDMAVNAVTFAYFSIHNRVEQQERLYAEYVAGTWKPRGLPAHKMPSFAADLVCEKLNDISLFAGDDSERIVRVLASFPYLAAAKATFTAALLGFPDAPCIDVHMARKIGIKNAPSDVTRYRAIAASSEINTTLAQWQAYECVPAYAHTQHDVYFASVLGPRAYVANTPTQLSLC